MDPNAVVEAFRRTITEHYIDFQGRSGRREFWYYVLAYVVSYVILAIVQGIIGTEILTGLFSLALLLPGLGISVRRLHDVDKSGWWILIGLVPIVAGGALSAMAFLSGSVGFGFVLMGLIWLACLAALALLVYWFAQPGTPGDNQYGPPPATPAA